MTVTLNLDDLATDASARRAFNSLSMAVAKSKKIVVVTGAGISCSCGIPDFRSSDGLYNLVKQQYPDVVLKGRDLFDASLFRDSTSTSVFYTFISQLKRSIDSASPSPTHNFIKTLDTKGKLLRSYTQNIDGLEERIGLLGSSSEDVRAGGKGKSRIRTKEVKNVQLHGDIHRVRCTLCSADFPCTEEYLESFLEGTAPDCSECSARSEARLARSARPIRIGSLRPAIVLYDEPHPLGDDIGDIQTSDIARRPDMLIIMGTSLKVHGFKKLVKDFAKAVHSHSPESTPTNSPPTQPVKNAKPWAGKVVFVNKTPPGSEWDGIIDYHVEGETDKWADKILEEWKKSRPADWEIQNTLTSMNGEEKAFKTVKDAAGKAKAAAGKSKTKPDSENRPPSLAKFTFTSGKTLPAAPSGFKKRRQPASHYVDGEDSRPKKRRNTATASRTKDAEAEKTKLFEDSTNNPDRAVPKEGKHVKLESDAPEPPARKAKAKSATTSTTAKAANKEAPKAVAGKNKEDQALDAVASKNKDDQALHTVSQSEARPFRRTRSQVYVSLPPLKG